MYTHPYLRDQALVYRALGNERRLYILEQLSKHPRKETELVDALQIRQSAVSKHLCVLRLARLIEGKRIGQEVIFNVSRLVNVKEVLTQKHLITIR